MQRAQVEKLEKETQQMLERCTPVKPKPSLPEAKVEEEGDVEMEPGEAVPTPEAATKDNIIERWVSSGRRRAERESPLKAKIMQPFNLYEHCVP